MSFLFGNGLHEVDSKGAVVNGVPGARQSRDPARPQTGESTYPHQAKETSVRMSLLFIFYSSQRSLPELLSAAEIAASSWAIIFSLS